jgi:Xaa-Pro aminopeptidase
MSKVPARLGGTQSHDIAKSDLLAEFMATGWAPSPLDGPTLDGPTSAEVVPYARARREKLSAMYPGVRLVIPAGSFKVRSNDTDYKFRAHTAYAWLTGISATDCVPDSVLILDPTKNGHESLLFIHPRSPRDTNEFHSDRRHGEFWIGRRLALEEAEKRYGISVRHIDTLDSFLENTIDTLTVRGEDRVVDSLVEKHKKRETRLLEVLSELRIIKDKYEINEIQKAVDVTLRGFNDMVRAFPAATSVRRGERIIESAFYGRARLEGNELGYDTIAAAGSHACVLHWMNNDGDVLPGDLILIDAGVEVESMYTADITRTIPINGKFSVPQRKIYMLVYQAQRAGIAAVKPGAPWTAFHDAAMAVLAKGLEELGVLPGTAEESLHKDKGFHRRWTIHSTGHMLGMDVHDCGQARKENYREGVLEAGMILTVEPGLYIQPDDLLFPIEYRGIGVRIEDDILVTKSGAQVMSRALPSHPDEVEVWVANLLR